MLISLRALRTVPLTRCLSPFATQRCDLASVQPYSVSSSMRGMRPLGLLCPSPLLARVAPGLVPHALQQRRRLCSEGPTFKGSGQQGQHGGSSCSDRRGGAVHAAAASATWDHSHDHSSHDHDHSGSSSSCSKAHCGDHGHEHQSHASSNGHSSSSSSSHAHGHHHSHSHHGHSHGHSHSHGHHHHHHHHNGPGGHHHHHFSTDAAASSGNPLLSALARTGLFSLAEHLEHHTAYTVASVSCFAAALAMPFCASGGLLPAATAALLAKAALSVTFLLSGIPQLAETVGAAAAGKVDTHVLMSLSVVGTLYMGMAQEGALLLLLFRVSHLLEDRLTEKAAGSLQRLFDSVPDSATLVEVEPGGAPRVATTQQVSASAVALGQHVLVRPGEQVPLDGVIVWGSANLSLQHISGEAAPVKHGPGQDVPAGSLSTDGLLVVRVEALSGDSTPARIAAMAAEAQAQRPQLTRWLDGVGEVWSKAVIGATLATAALLPLLGVPFFGDRGALYRSMGVLTAGSPCALALVPLAYACAIAAITARGMLIKSGAALDALAACSTIALDKTGTITTGSLNLAEGFVYNLQGQQQAAASSSSSEAQEQGRVTVRALRGLPELRALRNSNSNGSSGGRVGSTTGFAGDDSLLVTPTPSVPPSPFASSFDSDDYDANPPPGPALVGSSRSGAGSASSSVGFDAAALSCAVALSRLSNHPVSRAMVESAPAADADVAVLSFEQVPGSGVQGVVRVGSGQPVVVRFGASDWVSSYLTDQGLAAELAGLLGRHQDRPSRATAVLSICELQPAAAVAAAAAPAAGGQQQQQLASAEDAAAAVNAGPAAGGGGSRPSSPFRLASSRQQADGTLVFAFEEDLAGTGDQHQAAAAEAAAAADPHHHHHHHQHHAAQEQQAAAAGGDSASGSVDSAEHQQQYGVPGQPSRLALLCFDDVIQPGVPAAVAQLQSGSWSSSSRASSWLGVGSGAAAAKEVVMLTGDNQRVAAAVAGAVGISDFQAALKPEDKLAYVQAAAAAAAASADARRRAAGAGGLLMAGDGINDAPALAAAQVGVAIAATPKDMVAAAADIIVLNGQGITNLPWLFHIADRTHAILRQNLALALVSVAFATLPTVAGFFPLWLAVTLHEGSTLLVALNSLRLLLEAPAGSGSSKGQDGGGSSGHHHHH